MIANIIAFLAFVVSVISGIFAYNANKINKSTAEKNLNTRFFEEIYLKTIISDLPNSITEIKNANSKLDEKCDIAKNIINDLLSKSVFYKYFDKEFYDDVKESIIKIEDELFKLQDKCNKSIVFEQKQNLEKEINNLYKILRNYYSKI